MTDGGGGVSGEIHDLGAYGCDEGTRRGRDWCESVSLPEKRTPS